MRVQRSLPAAFVLWAAVAATATPAPAGELDRARQLLEEEAWEEAERVLAFAAKDPSAQGESLVLLTRLATARGDLDAAVEYGKQAVAVLPASAEAHLRLAVALRDQLARVSKLKALSLLGSYKEALGRALALDPGHVEARAEEIGFLLAAPGIAGGDKEKARRRAEELLALDARRGSTMKALLMRADGDAEGAVRLLRDHLQRHPDDHDNRLMLAMFLQDAKRFAEADRELEPLLTVHRPSVALRATFQLARSRVLGGFEPERAVALLESYLARRPPVGRSLPSRANAYWRLGQAHQQRGSLDKARAAFEQALALEPDNQEVAKALKALPKR